MSVTCKPSKQTALGREPSCGLGRCGRCSCPSFVGAGNICEDCGHHYGDHGTSPFRACVVGENQVEADARRVRCVGKQSAIAHRK
jgi:hypothetical protein